MKCLYFLLFLPILLPSLSVERNSRHETINEIAYTSFDGGKGGRFFSLKVTKAYTSLEIGSANSRKSYGEVTNPNFWKQLAKTNLREFDTLLSSERTAEADGTDVEIQITTDVKKHAVVNGQYRNSKRIIKLFALLESKIADIAKPANQKYPE